MFERYAIYYTANGAFANRGATWLGWDVALGAAVPHPIVEGLDMAAVTETPRKYGFHGTIKPPFRLAEGSNEAGLRVATEAFTKQIPSVRLEGLEVTAFGRFLALTPVGDTANLNDTAANVVRSLDAFRAPMTAEELARRRTANLTSAQEHNLRNWGYPHVMDQFRFHMTLTKRLPKAGLAKVRDMTQNHFASVLPRPFVLDALTLTGQRPDGMFETIERFPLKR